MKRLLAAGFVVVTLTNCSAMHTTHQTPDEISIRYDTLVHSVKGATERAERHCAVSGRNAELVSTWLGGATFRCT